MSWASRFFLFILSGISCVGWAQGSCLPPFNALQEMAVLESGSTLVRPLVGMNQYGFFQTKVQAIAKMTGSAEPALELSFRFDPDFEGVSLPFNLYAVLILKDGEVLSWMDLTHGCTGPGVGFFPGREVRLPKIKLIGVEPQTLHIMVWGKL